MREQYTEAEIPGIQDDYESAYRQASVFFFGLLEVSLAHVMASNQTRVGMAQIRVALGLAEESMSEIAGRLGVTPACISKGARSFIRENNLPIPKGMEGEESSKAHREARNRQLKTADQPADQPQVRSGFTDHNKEQRIEELKKQAASTSASSFERADIYDEIAELIGIPKRTIKVIEGNVKYLPQKADN